MNEVKADGALVLWDGIAKRLND